VSGSRHRGESSGLYVVRARSLRSHHFLAAGHPSAEEENIAPSAYLRGAKAAVDSQLAQVDSSGRTVSIAVESALAQVDSQLAQVDALLEKAGLPPSVALLPTMPIAPSRAALEDVAAVAAAAAMDPSALYERALELYGVNADADATRSKMKAISERTQARMAELRQQSALMPPMQKSPSRGPLAATSARGPLP